ncbi:MAG: PilN domain-containing protein [Armatimonadetes bacterium]|nr:PilN domain-containing protein [Armatimonadota bacterium]
MLIEWDREWVRVHFVETAQTREAQSLDGLDGLSGKTAIVLLSRRLVLQRSIPLPDAQRGDVLIALKMRLADVFPIPASELAFDYIPTTEKNENGRVCIVFAARTADIAEIIGITQRLGIQIQQIVPSQALTIKAAEQNAVSSGVFVERFGDFVNLDAYRYGDLMASKLVTLHSLDTELSRMKAMTGDGSKVLSYKVSLDGSEQNLGAPFIESFAQSNLSIDLEPEDYRTARVEQSRKLRQRQSSIVFIGGLVLTIFTVNEYWTANQNFTQADAKAAKRVKNLAKPVEALESDAKKLQPAADQLKTAFKPPQSVSDILKVVSALTPKDTWLTNVTFERGKELQIRGVSKKAELVSAYALALTQQKEQRFRDVKLVFANGGDIEGTPTVQFSMTAFPVGNLPMIEIGKKKK